MLQWDLGFEIANHAIWETVGKSGEGNEECSQRVSIKTPRALTVQRRTKRLNWES